LVVSRRQGGQWKREGKSADGGLFIAAQPRILASQDAETQVLPAQPQPTGDPAIGTVISIHESVVRLF
jgi:hypothetical protein